MREVALILLEKLHAAIPVLFDDLWEDYCILYRKEVNKE